MSIREGGRLALLGLAVLSAWEVGTSVATYLFFATGVGPSRFVYLSELGFNQVDSLAFNLGHDLLSAVIALPLVLLAARLLLRRQDVETRV
ncbi:MAG: hypothetical protein H0V92_06065 [Pseudonocardiales bacterium]|nr:hypothetical protein [Pseudonocardiales bacterium]